MYSSVSLAMVGDNSVTADLRVLTSIELYIKVDYYCEHPYFLSAYGKHKEKVCHSLKNILPLSVSHRAFDSSLSGRELVKVEAILNCHDKTWSSFLCILGLASVTNRNILSYYPDFGEQKFRLLFNCKVEPCPPLRSLLDLHILFCFRGEVKSGEIFKPDHFVPLLYHDGAGGEKRKLQTVSPSLHTWTPTCTGNVPKAKKSCSNNVSNKMVQSKLSFSSSVSAPSPKPSPKTTNKKTTIFASTSDSLTLSGNKTISSVPTCNDGDILPSTSTSTTITNHEYDVAYYRKPKV